MNERGPDHYDALPSTLDKVKEGLERAGLDFGKEALSRLEVFLSRGDENEKLRHMQEFKQSPESTAYALELGDRHPKAMVDHLEGLDAGLKKNLSPEDVEAVRLNLIVASESVANMEDVGVMRDLWTQGQQALQSKDMDHATVDQALAKLERGDRFDYKDLVQLGGVDRANKRELYYEMDDSSQLRFAATFPAEPFIEGDMLERVLVQFDHALPPAMGRLSEHPYSWRIKDNPLNNPNLSAQQLDQAYERLSQLKCNPKNLEANLQATRAMQVLAKHPNTSANTQKRIQNYMDWLREKSEDEQS